MSLVWILLVLVIAAAIIGFGGVVSVAASIFKIVFWVLLVMFLVGLILGLTRRRGTVA
ncbi:MAG: DUF1328 domain-containing protein [Armatimonadia bacterium]